MKWHNLDLNNLPAGAALYGNIIKLLNEDLNIADRYRYELKSLEAKDDSGIYEVEVYHIVNVPVKLAEFSFTITREFIENTSSEVQVKAVAAINVTWERVDKSSSEYLLRQYRVNNWNIIS